MLQKAEYICLFFMGYEWLNYVGSINKQEYFWLKSLGPNRVDLSWCLSVGDHLFLVSPHPEFIVNAEYLCTSICQPTLWLTFAYETGCLPAVGTWTVMALRELTGQGLLLVNLDVKLYFLHSWHSTESFWLFESQTVRGQLGLMDRSTSVSRWEIISCLWATSLSIGSDLLPSFSTFFVGVPSPPCGLAPPTPLFAVCQTLCKMVHAFKGFFFTIKAFWLKSDSLVANVASFCGN